MRSLRRPSQLAAFLASIPLIIPGAMQTANAKEPVRARLVSKTNVPEVKPLDIVLLHGNVIAGQVIAADGTPVAEAEVTVSVGRYEVVRVTTDQAGEFAAEVPHGGVYVLTSGNSASLVRAWTATAAPPNAPARVTLAPQITVIRAQGPAGGGVDPLMGLLLVGGIAAAIAIPIALNNNGSNASKNTNTTPNTNTSINADNSGNKIPQSP